MNKKTWMVLAAMAARSCGIPAVAQNDAAKPVEAVELVRSPQRYWAKSFVFADVLRLYPSGGVLKLDGRRYISFSTYEAGRCYVATELAHVLKALPLERRYHFMGTMLQHGRRFFIIVRGVSAAVEAGDLKLNWPEISDSPADHMKNQALRPILNVLTAAESAQVAYAEEKGVALSDLYDPQSPHYGQAMGLMRSTLMAQEQKAKRPSSEMLAEYLFQVLVARHPAPEKPAQAPGSPVVMETPTAPEIPAATEAPAVKAPPTTETPPATEINPPAEEPPKRLTRQERREQARRKKTEALAEKKRHAAKSKPQAAEEPIPLPPVTEPPPAVPEAPTVDTPSVPAPEVPPSAEIKPSAKESPKRLTRQERMEMARRKKAEATEEKKRRAAELEPPVVEETTPPPSGTEPPPVELVPDSPAATEAPVSVETPVVETPPTTEAPAATEIKAPAEEPLKRLTRQEQREIARKKKAEALEAKQRLAAKPQAPAAEETIPPPPVTEENVPAVKSSEPSAEAAVEAAESVSKGEVTDQFQPVAP